MSDLSSDLDIQDNLEAVEASSDDESQVRTDEDSESPRRKTSPGNISKASRSSNHRMSTTNLM